MKNKLPDNKLTRWFDNLGARPFPEYLSSMPAFGKGTTIPKGSGPKYQKTFYKVKEVLFSGEFVDQNGFTRNVVDTELATREEYEAFLLLGEQSKGKVECQILSGPDNLGRHNFDLRCWSTRIGSEQNDTGWSFQCFLGNLEEHKKLTEERGKEFVIVKSFN